MPDLDQILGMLGRGRQLRIDTRQGGGLGDAMNRASADVKYGIFPGATAEMPDNEVPAPPIDDVFDDSMMLPFVSSNVEGGYFRRYFGTTAEEHENLLNRGDLYLKFQKRRPEVPGGRPIGFPRGYVYQNVSESVWMALLSAGSPGGVVWDVIRHGGIPGDRIS